VRQFISRTVLLLLVAYALYSVYGAATLFWQPAGTIGLATDYAATIRKVFPDSPAARVDIRTGDRIRLGATPFKDRSYVSGPGTSVPIGDTITVATTRDGVDREFHLKAVFYSMKTGERAALLLLCVSALIFIGVGATLIVLRQSPATWGFGLYCLLILPTSIYPLPLPPVAGLISTLFYDIAQNIGVAGLVLFTLEFPRPFDAPWRERARRLLPALVVVLSLMTMYPDVANQLLARPAEFENTILQIAFGAVFAFAMFTLNDSYRRVDVDERARLRWVLIGFGAGLLTNYIGSTLIFSTIIAGAPPAWLAMTLSSLDVLLPLTVMHAVVRHRVLDVRFVAGRALVFAVMTTLLAAAFALMDYVFGTILEDFQISRVIAAVISLGIAFTFKWMEERLNRTVEAIFFRKRHAAETRLRHAGHMLPQARSATVVAEALVDEAVDALDLASVALFTQSDEGHFRRTKSFGWSDADCASLGDEDRLVFTLRTDRADVDLANFTWRHTDLPGDGREPVVVIPIRRHDELNGFVLYGAHADGGALEPSELTLLERLAYGAGLAYEQLEAQQMRDENARQRATIVDLTARLDELRHHLP
jgi:hypothetical protein